MARDEYSCPAMKRACKEVIEKGDLIVVTHANVLAPVVQTLDSAIHWINHYPADKYLGNQLRYQLVRFLSSGQHYPTFEQPGPEDFTKLARDVRILHYDVIMA